MGKGTSGKWHRKCAQTHPQGDCPAWYNCGKLNHCSTCCRSWDKEYSPNRELLKPQRWRRYYNSENRSSVRSTHSLEALHGRYPSDSFQDHPHQRQPNDFFQDYQKHNRTNELQPHIFYAVETKYPKRSL